MLDRIEEESPEQAMAAGTTDTAATTPIVMDFQPERIVPDAAKMVPSVFRKHLPEGQQEIISLIKPPAPAKKDKWTALKLKAKKILNKSKTQQADDTSAATATEKKNIAKIVEDIIRHLKEDVKRQKNSHVDDGAAAEHGGTAATTTAITTNVDKKGLRARVKTIIKRAKAKADKHVNGGSEVELAEMSAGGISQRQTAQPRSIVV